MEGAWDIENSPVVFRSGQCISLVAIGCRDLEFEKENILLLLCCTIQTPCVVCGDRVLNNNDLDRFLSKLLQALVDYGWIRLLTKTRWTKKPCATCFRITVISTVNISKPSAYGILVHSVLAISLTTYRPEIFYLPTPMISSIWLITSWPTMIPLLTSYSSSLKRFVPSLLMAPKLKSTPCWRFYPSVP